MDLYCGAGGTTKGIKQAIPSVKVTGIDSKPQPRYCGDEFIQMNVLEIDIEWARSNFDFVFASPPCQAFVPMANRTLHYNLIPKTRTLLNTIGLPWIIENVPNAPLPRFITLCGTMFPPLRVIRHRRFEFSNDILIRQPYHIPKDEHPKVFSFDRRGARMRGLNEDEYFVTVAGNNCSLGAASDAMGIYHMTRPEIAQAVPPAYAKYITKEIIKQLKNT